MQTEHSDNLTELEEQLRAAAPSLPPALRARTLARCEAQLQRQQHQQRRSSKRLIWALAGVYAFQWVVVSLLDSQQAASLLPPSQNSRVPYTTVAATQNHSVATLGTIQARSQTLATLMSNRNEWLIFPESG